MLTIAYPAETVNPATHDDFAYDAALTAAKAAIETLPTNEQLEALISLQATLARCEGLADDEASAYRLTVLRCWTNGLGGRR